MTEEKNQPAHPSAASQEVQLERLESAVLPYEESGYYQMGDTLAPYWFIESIAQGDPLMLGYGKSY
jgi:hypothetical protein